jgi:hypothetical protein
MNMEDFSTVAVSVGGNIGNEFMGLKAWDDFRDRIYNAVKSCPSSLILATTHGQGEYASNNGDVITEETFIVLAQVRNQNLQGLQVLLAGIGYIYAQEGIGFTAAPAHTTFIPCEGFNTERN